MAELNQLTSAITDGKMEIAVSITDAAIKENISPSEGLEDMVKGMEEIGQRFEEGKAFVPNLLMAARAMKAALELLRPLLQESGAKPLGKVVIGTVKGDLHDIGKNIVASMLEGAGFEIVNLGVDIAAEKFVEAVQREKPDVLALSALLTTTMTNMKGVIDAIEAAGLRNQVRIIIGGAPISEEFCKQIGADGYSTNGNAAVRLAKELVA
jgi:corrinoid protein of di/trimethylamine methyltransferase